MDYSKICFVTMPLGTKPVGNKTVDFDAVYEQIFAPAIAAVDLPEGGKLNPRRIDKDLLAGNIRDQTLDYLEYSRLVIADISGLNFNVAYELGVRHKTNERGTVIFRQSLALVPFSVSSFKAFPYDFEPSQAAVSSRELITRVLSEMLIRDQAESRSEPDRRETDITSRNRKSQLQPRTQPTLQAPTISVAKATPAHSSTSTPSARTRVFVSYSRRDTKWLERVRTHLGPIEVLYGVDFWDDKRIEAGADWRQEIREAISQTKVAILLVTADFLASDFIRENELPPLLQEAEKGGALILSLIVSPSRFSAIETLSRFQTINDPQKPLTRLGKFGSEEILVKLADAVESALKSID